MRELLKGKVIRALTSDGFIDIGRIVYDFRETDDVIYIPYPKSPADNRAQKGRRLLAPRRINKSRILLLGAGNEVVLVDYVMPLPWNLTDEQLQSNVILDKNRRKLSTWFEFREAKKKLINPIISKYDEYEILELGMLNNLVNIEGEKHGAGGQRKITQTMRRYLFGCGHPNALLPNWGSIGGKGTEKYCDVKTGRPSKRRALPDAEPEYVVTKDDRRWLFDGYHLYKKQRVSERQAYLLTCVKYYPGASVETDEKENKYSVAPRAQRPTISQFRRAGKAQGLTASGINMGERVHRMTQRALTGNASDGIYAVGQLGLIDSTSEDQTPVSSIDPLRILPSTYRTICMDVRSEYILGIYCGFEHPSTLTSLLTILNCTMPKVEFCKRYGVNIEDGEWHSRLCKRIRGDNGELKSEQGIKTLNSMEVIAEFVQSYRGDLKGPVEAAHKILHRQADHLAAGSTLGKRRERSEPAREKQACRSFEQNMPYVIRAVLRHNNEELVPKLLTVEMRRDGVKPTRRAIYEWYVDHGYVASEPTNLIALRAHCLPRLKAVIQRDGLHVFDPRDAQRLIPNLIYTGKWLVSSKLGERAAKKRIHCEVLLDPQNMEVCYVYKNDELNELRRKTTDPLASHLSLCEYLHMTDEDWMVVDRMRPALEASDAHTYASNDELNRSAKKTKTVAQAAFLEAETPARKGNANGHEKRQNRSAEIKRKHLETLGFEHLKVIRTTHAPPKVGQLVTPPHNATSELMAQLRNRKSRTQ